MEEWDRPFFHQALQLQFRALYNMYNDTFRERWGNDYSGYDLTENFLNDIID